MNPNYPTKLATLTTLFIFILYIVPAQDGTIDPKISEVYSPVPPKVTPGEGTTPPSDAIVLFDGSNLENWKPVRGDGMWTVDGDAFIVKPGTGDIETKQAFGDIQLHIEWKSPTNPQGETGQSRGNSGIFLQTLYEIQVLDNYTNKTYTNGQVASVYKQHVPLVNASLPTGEWQTYDIIFQAPLFKEDGSLGRPAAVTVIHNGVLALNHVILKGPTEYERWPQYKAHPEKLPLRLQDHGNEVSYRNIWIREL